MTVASRAMGLPAACIYAATTNLQRRTRDIGPVLSLNIGECTGAEREIKQSSFHIYEAQFIVYYSLHGGRIITFTRLDAGYLTCDRQTTEPELSKSRTKRALRYLFMSGH